MRLIERGDCPMRHENGNCTVAGGFCTAVNDPICEALHNAFHCGEQSKVEWATLMIAEQTTKYAEKQLAVLREIHKKITAETTDPEELRPRGEWEVTVLESSDRVFRTGAPHCNKCGRQAPHRTPFCPNCGADMRGDTHG